MVALSCTYRNLDKNFLLFRNQLSVDGSILGNDSNRRLCYAVAVRDETHIGGAVTLSLVPEADAKPLVCAANVRQTPEMRLMPASNGVHLRRMLSQQSPS